ncbi:BTB/POZ domain protein [Opisthorchis viverrini]|uniref:BTB/POZ domain protein n=1 Tax=Opisthorchis viverrini TaxID=6198 RepID=A0A1S8X4K1_OPIVI|nr:BTB/POZ domain protein [Opisthorchis viverrini]
MDFDRTNVGAENDVSSRVDEDNATGESYSMAAFTKMNTFRKRGQLCDVVIKVGGREFLAHRVVLAATSDYFDAMFSNGMAESAQLEVELKSISPDIMDALLDYVYTGQVRVTMENVQDLLPAASLVQMEGVKTACSNFLLAEVDASNVLGIRRFAELHNCSDLEKFSRNYAAHNFELVADYEEFLCLNHEELLDLIAREDLHIDCEESVYKAVMRWVYHQSTERIAHLSALLSHIRLPVMSVRFLTDVVDKDVLIRQSLECRDLVDDAKRFHLRPDLRHEMRERRYRQRDCGDEYLVVIGGFGSDQNPSDSVEMFNPRTLEWNELPDLPISYRYVAACSLDTCVYVIGGFDGRERLNTVCLLDIAQREDGWRWLTPMHYKRGLSAACTHKGLIYVCGGFDGQSRLRSLEVYHPKIDEWRILEDMTTSREGAGLVVVDDTLYCLGGYDGFHLLNSMEAFDLRRGSWSVCKPMYMRRSGAGCALLGDTIYVCGGYGGAEGRGPLHLDTVEAYNVRLQQWTLVTSMNVPRCYVGACPLAGKIYVAAGYNGSRLLDTVESYDPVENVWWLHDESRMNHERCDTGMCVVRFLPCSGLPVSGPASCSSRVSTSVAVIPSNHGVTQTISDAQSSAQQVPLASGQSAFTRRLQDASNYRIPMLPLVPHLRSGVNSLFRPGLSSHRSYSSETEPTSSHAAPTALRTGFQAMTNVTSASFRGSPRLGSRNFPVGSLHRHPDLPGRHQLPFSAHGLFHSTRGGLGNRSTQAAPPRSPRQPFSNRGVGLGELSRGTELSASSSANTLRFSEAASGVVDRVSPTMSTATSSEQTATHPTVEHSYLDADSVELNQYLSHEDPTLSNVEAFPEHQDPNSYFEPAEHHIPVSLRSLSPRQRLGDPVEPISDSHIRDPTFQASSSSSPTILSRMYHSAPESGPCQARHPELFRSAEALNANPSDYRTWLVRNAALLDHDQSGSDSGSELNYSRMESQVGGFCERQSEHEDRRLNSFSDTFNTVPTDTLFSYLRLEETSLDEQEPDAASDGSAAMDDTALSSPSNSVHLSTRITGQGVGDYVSSGQLMVSPSYIIPAGADNSSEVYPSSVLHNTCAFSTASSLGAPHPEALFCPIGSSGDSNWNHPRDANTRRQGKMTDSQVPAIEQTSCRHFGAEVSRRRAPVNPVSGSDEISSEQEISPTYMEPSSTVDPVTPSGERESSLVDFPAPSDQGITEPSLLDSGLQSEPVTSSDQATLPDGLPYTPTQTPAQGAPDISCSLAREQHTAGVPDLVSDAGVDVSVYNSDSPSTEAERNNACVAIGQSSGVAEVPSSVDLRSDGEGEEDDDDPRTSRGNPAIGQ